MNRHAFTALAFSLAALAGCGGGGDAAKYEALCRKAGIADEAVKTMVAEYSKASSDDRADMMKAMQSVVDNPPAAGEEEED